MSTQLQKNLAQNIVKNAKRKKPLNKEELVISSGYAVKTAEGHAPNIIEQKGVKEELIALGFHPDNAKRVVNEILNDERTAPTDRLRAAQEVFKVHGTYAAEKRVNVNVEVEASEEVKELTQRLNELYRSTGGAGDGGTSGPLGIEAPDKERDGTTD